jgi:Asp-tRNA(Asn)/Glu-tRNA(Gln) amidotransferase A subunit family amidase
MSTRQPVGPSGDSALCYRSALELRDLLDNKQISATELLEAHLARTDQNNYQALS